MSSPSFVAPWKNSTFVILPSESLEVAEIVIVAGAVNRLPGGGLVMLTVGGEFGASVLKK